MGCVRAGEFASSASIFFRIRTAVGLPAAMAGPRNLLHSEDTPECLVLLVVVEEPDNAGQVAAVCDRGRRLPRTSAVRLVIWPREKRCNYREADRHPFVDRVLELGDAQSLDLGSSGTDKSSTFASRSPAAPADFRKSWTPCASF